MTILVTGSSGFIGSNMVKYLENKKVKFIGIDKIKNPYFNLKKFYKLNLLNKKKLERLINKKKIKHIIHLAAIPGFVNCHKNPELAFKNNIEATFNLIYVANKYKVKNILIASSMGVNNFEKNPGFYSFTKLVCEKMGKTYSSINSIKIKICKISNVFGPYSAHKSSVVHVFIKKILKDQKLLIHKNGKQERDFIYVDEVCERLYRALFKNSTKDIAINTNKFLRVLDIKNMLHRISNKKIVCSYVSTPKGYDDTIYYKPLMKKNQNFIKKLEKTFNWYMNTDKNI